MVEARTAFTDEQYANPYPPGIEAHYWQQARNNIVVRKLERVLRTDTKALDIGCGPGIVVDHLRKSGVDCQGVDLGTPTPATTHVAPHLHLGTSAFELAEPLRNSISLLLLMDVLEHLPEPAEFLAQCLRSFPNVKHVFITLPARMEIWSTYDEYYGHHHRYKLEELAAVIGAGGLSVASSGYFFHALYWAARAMSLKSKERDICIRAPGVRWPHALLGRLFAWEERVVGAGSPGSSLFALLERRA